MFVSWEVFFNYSKILTFIISKIWQLCSCYVLCTTMQMPTVFCLYDDMDLFNESAPIST
jgi:hypothetical protein